MTSCFPGETLVECAMRESKEETGLVLKNDRNSAGISLKVYCLAFADFKLYKAVQYIAVQYTMFSCSGWVGFLHNAAGPHTLCSS